MQSPIHEGYEYQDYFTVSKLVTPISNGGLIFTPPGPITGSARGGVSQHHDF